MHGQKNIKRDKVQISGDDTNESELHSIRN